MIGKEEYRDRLAQLQRKIAENNLDAFLVSAEDSIYYLTGVSYKPLERPFFMIVRPQSAPALLVPALEQEHLKAAPNIDEVFHYWDYPAPLGQGWPERLLDLLDNPDRLGVEPSLSQEIALALQNISSEVVPLIEKLRLIKSPSEVLMLRQAAHYADLAIQRLIRASYYGVSELELFSQGRTVQIQIMKDTDYDLLATDVLAGSWPAPLSAQPHGVPAIADRLEEGPHIALGFLRVNGYAAECERTYFLEPPTGEVKEAFTAMLEARRRAFDLLRPGANSSEIDAATKDFLQEEGYSDYLLHRTGHGFGLSNHEGPWLSEGSSDVLQENMLVSIEPGIYLPGVGGIRHSDTTLVTKDGYENLTTYPTDLKSLTIKSYKPLTRLRGALVRRAMGI